MVREFMMPRANPIVVGFLHFLSGETESNTD
jgi:hypothetical protein